MIHLLGAAGDPGLVLPATVVTMVVGTLIPAAIALITRASLPSKAKTILTLFLTAVSGVVATIITWPTGGSGWWHLVLNVLMTFATAASADPSLWRGQVKAGTYIATIHSDTDKHFGIGSSYEPDLTYAA